MSEVKVVARELKTRQIGIRMEPSLYEKIESAAKAAKVSPSEYVRQILALSMSADSPKL